jgi:4-methylaminobutanoate oxidase (formaldehyde-forming)
MKTARGAKISAVYDRLKENGAYFRDVSGWEGADWFAPTPQQAVIEKHAWGREPWFGFWEAEHRAARKNVVLMDMSFMPKFLVQGKDSGKVLDYICANAVDGPAGRITYTTCLNKDGQLMADLTVTKLSSDRFFVVVTDTIHRHALAWIQRHIPDTSHAFVTDMTSAYAQVNIQGPKSRELLQSVTDTDLSNTAFPFRHAQKIAIGYGRPLAAAPGPGPGKESGTPAVPWRGHLPKRETGRVCAVWFLWIHPGRGCGAVHDRGGCARG